VGAINQNNGLTSKPIFVGKNYTVNQFNTGHNTGLASLIFNWQKWRFSAPQTHLWLIKVWFSASTFFVKIATFAKPETVRPNITKTVKIN
jgi:hypothetical protein